MRSFVRLVVFFSLFFMVIGCGVAADEVDLRLTLSPSTLIFSPDSGYKGELSMAYRLENLSGFEVSSLGYVLSLSISGLRDETSTILHSPSFSAGVGEVFEGEFTHQFDYVAGEEGEHIIRLELFERDNHNLYSVDSTSVPVFFVYE
jgi:hypothetical protein